jgi:hypothetical protein
MSPKKTTKKMQHDRITKYGPTLPGSTFSDRKYSSDTACPTAPATTPSGNITFTLIHCQSIGPAQCTCSARPGIGGEGAHRYTSVVKLGDATGMPLVHAGIESVQAGVGERRLVDGIHRGAESRLTGRR